MTKNPPNINASDALRALHTFSSLALGTEDGQYPPFSYGTTAPNQFPLTKNNCLPALVVWLFLVTNIDYLNALDGNEPGAMVSVSQIAQATNLTEGAVNTILDAYRKASGDSKAGFVLVNKAFQNLAGLSGYVGGNCPDTGHAMLQLAEQGASVNPNS